MGCGASTNTIENNPHLPAPHQLQRVIAIPHHTITPSIPYNNGLVITRAQLQSQRAEFWSTRVDGNALMWQAIKSAAEASIARDNSLAIAILEASNISLPNGSLELCYDERGFQYKIPVFCFSDPMSVVDVADGTIAVGETLPNGFNFTEALGSDRPKSIKVVEAKNMNIRIRINPGDVNMIVAATSLNSVLELKKIVLEKVLQVRTQAPEESSTAALDSLCAGDEGRLRLIYMGRELQPNLYLGDLGLDDVRVLQVFLRPAVQKVL